MIVTRRHFTTSASLLIAGGAVSAPLSSALAQSAGGSADPVVETRYGKVRGQFANGVYAFKAVPYGASTAGANRFMPPRPPQPWAGVKDCLAWGSSSPQPSEGANQATDFRTYFGIDPGYPTARSEDCLILNVFTPALRDGRKRPVVLWIHGGGYSSGSGSGARTDGSNIARQQDVVEVSINHRLFVLGYTNLGAVDPAFEAAATVGQLDIVAALQWVRDNIEAFGGDPGRVMIHGESGGGSKVNVLLAMPKAEGLFHRAACQSGVASSLPTREEAAPAAEALLRELSLTRADVRKIQTVPVDQVIAAARKVAAMPGMTRRAFVPSVGGIDLPLAPFEAVARGSAANIPLIVGCTLREGALGLRDTDLAALTMEEVHKRATSLGPNAAELIDGYRANHPEYTPGEVLVRAMSERSRISSIGLAEAHIEGGNVNGSGAPTWMYLFSWITPVLPHMGAGHAADTTFYFANTDTVGIAENNPQAKSLAAKMSGAWASLARNGVPMAPDLPQWPPYTLERRATMIFDAESHVEYDPLGKDRLLRA